MARRQSSIQIRIPVTYMRGGSSKALFFHEHDIPPPGLERDSVLKRAMGTPDPLQIDGMGGTRAVTSKIAIIRSSARTDADVDYTFAQVGVSNDFINYNGNCGNISSAVGPFAIEEGLVKTFRPGLSFVTGCPTQEVRVHVTGSSKILITHVPIDESGLPIIEGDFAIAAVPGTGAPILMDYRATVGATLGKGILPTGNTINQTLVDGQNINFTACDVANLVVYAHARDFNISLLGEDVTSAALTANTGLILKIKQLRGKAAQMIGMCRNWEDVDRDCPFLPMVCLVDCSLQENHISTRLFLDNMCHESMAGTGAVCTTACSRITGSIVQNASSNVQQMLDDKVMRISHPRGVMAVSVEVVETTGSDIQFRTLSFVRTARRIMDGHVYIPKTAMVATV